MDYLYWKSNLNDSSAGCFWSLQGNLNFSPVEFCSVHSFDGVNCWVFWRKVNEAISFGLTVVVLNNTTIVYASEISEGLFQKVAVNVQWQVVYPNAVTLNRRVASFTLTTHLVSCCDYELSVHVCSVIDIRWSWVVLTNGLTLSMEILHRFLLSVTATTSHFYSIFNAAELFSSLVMVNRVLSILLRLSISIRVVMTIFVLIILVTLTHRWKWM